MAFKWKLCVFVALFSTQLSHSFILNKELDNPKCKHSDNELALTGVLPESNCLWLEKALRTLPKYRNFFAGLLLEENGELAYELQEIYNVISSVMAEKDRMKKRKQLLVAKWLMETNKKLYKFLLKKGILNIDKHIFFE